MQNTNMRLESELKELSGCTTCKQKCGKQNVVIITLFSKLPKEILSLIELAKLIGMKEQLPEQLQNITIVSGEIVSGKFMIPTMNIRDLISKLSTVEEEVNRKGMLLEWPDKDGLLCNRGESEDSLFGNIPPKS